MLDQHVLMQALFVETGKSPLFRKWDRIADGLSSDQSEKRAAAEKRLEGERDDAAKILHTMVQYDVRLYRSEKRWRQVLALSAAVLCVLFACGAAQNAAVTREALSFSIMPMWLAMPFVIALYDTHAIRRRRLNNTLLLLTRYNVSQSVGALIELMECGDPSVSPLAAASLTLLLTRPASAQRPRLTKRHHQYLYRALIGGNANKILAALAALEQFGEPAALPHVQRMIHCPHWILESERIRAAAKQCFRILSRKAETRAASLTLLRASSRTELSDRTLLRPAGNTAAAVPQELLRACDRETTG